MGQRICDASVYLKFIYKPTTRFVKSLGDSKPASVIFDNKINQIWSTEYPVLSQVLFIPFRCDV